jgi:regulatory protein
MARKRGGAAGSRAAPYRSDDEGPGGPSGGRAAGWAGGGGAGVRRARGHDPEGGDSAGRRAASAPATPADPSATARDICLRLLAVRPRTRAELAGALRRRGLADEVIAEVLGRYGEVGMVDDEAFARAWVTSRHHGRGLARRALAGELRRKGVESEAVDVALAEVDGDTEEATARALVQRRLAAERGALRRATDAAARQREEAALIRRLVGLLARKGYPSGLAFRVVKDALAAHAETADAAELLDLDASVEEPDG